jgi:hypothetical protein
MWSAQHAATLLPPTGWENSIGALLTRPVKSKVYKESFAKVFERRECPVPSARGWVAVFAYKRQLIWFAHESRTCALGPGYLPKVTVP